MKCLLMLERYVEYVKHTFLYSCQLRLDKKEYRKVCLISKRMWPKFCVNSI